MLTITIKVNKKNPYISLPYLIETLVFIAERLLENLCLFVLILFPVIIKMKLNVADFHFEFCGFMVSYKIETKVNIYALSYGILLLDSFSMNDFVCWWSRT